MPLLAAALAVGILVAGASGNPIAWSIVAVAGLALPIALGPRSRTRGPWAGAAWTGVAAAAMIALVTAAPDGPTRLVTMIAFAVGLGLVTPLVYAFTFDADPPDELP